MVSGCRSVIIPYKGNETCVMNHHVDAYQTRPGEQVPKVPAIESRIHWEMYEVERCSLRLPK
jgi:hypothetical protein